MSVDITYTGAPVAEDRVADAWDAIEHAFGAERVAALEDAGLSIAWGADHLAFSLPYGHGQQAATDFDRLADLTARELGERFDWEAEPG